MSRITTGLVLGAVLALGAGSALALAQSATPPAPTSTTPVPVRKPMFEAMLNGLKSPEAGKDVDSVMYITDFPPGAVSSKHSHPGWEFNYILKGSITYEVVGQAPVTLKAGEGTYNQRGNVHVVKNASQTEPAQLVAVLVKDAGAPIAVNVP